jgi:transposase
MNKQERKTKVTSTQKQQPETPGKPRATGKPKPLLFSALPKALSADEFLQQYEQQQAVRRRLSKAEPETDRLVESILQAHPQPERSPRTSDQVKPYALIKLGIDVHLDCYVVVRQIDGGTPQPAQKFSSREDLAAWIEKQSALAQKVYSCYEAGPLGYSLHRQLLELGVSNYVVRPRDWDEYGQKVKTDKRDARELCLHLDRYVAGNEKAFCVVRVPSEAQEQARSRSRQRESLQREKQRLAAQGRSHALYYGAHLKGEWWVEGRWKELVLAPIVLELLQPLRRLIVAIEQELKAQTQALEAAAPPALPIGLGKLTYECLEREICDWHRFTNRRQVGSYTGMCPREDTSDERRFQGSINKHGNPRVRRLVVELAWRLLQFQPTYQPVAKWRPVLLNPKTTKAKRKQITVAIGRQFSVDWWRVRTGRARAEDLGLKIQPDLVQEPSGSVAEEVGASGRSGAGSTRGRAVAQPPLTAARAAIERLAPGSGWADATGPAHRAGSRTTLQG